MFPLYDRCDGVEIGKIENLFDSSVEFESNENTRKIVNPGICAWRYALYKT